ncbi:hypothetical protein HK099_007912 [Clydaea vesicula]|uniref:Uncharacterized protein n=1 Tax=Clydaea vesicula TaxID=447962 RepID=A0AAD5XW47_9FUNG|nr:hypothetical protein HK099_007912 [Clydaea vesicula]
MNFSKVLRSGKKTDTISPKQQRKQKLQTLSKQASNPKRPRDNLLETLITFNDKIEDEPEEKKRMLSYKVTDSSVKYIESQDTVEARLNHVEDENKEIKQRLDKLENRVYSLEKWMAKPCLHTALETTFKKKMKTPSTNRLGFFDLLNDCVESDILKYTGIDKATWIGMESFLNTRPNSRNDIVHHDIPDNVLVEDCFDSLKATMDEPMKRNFRSFLNIL